MKQKRSIAKNIPSMRLSSVNRGYPAALHECKGLTIGVVLPGSNPSELFFAIQKQLPDHDYFVFVPGASSAVVEQFHLSGVRYATDAEAFLMLMDELDCALSFGALPHVAHLPVLVALSALRDLGIPTIDIQHGLFQWGINFTDSSLHQGYSPDTGVSLPLHTEADVQVTWAGENAVGYPRLTEDATQPPPIEGSSPILIATNTNWHIYSPEERIRLAQTLRQLFSTLPAQRFLFKPHPAEFGSTTNAVSVLLGEITRDPHLFPNVEILLPMSRGGETLTQLIGKCRAGIATVGTALIDYEMLGRPCAVFGCRSVSLLLDSLPRVTEFSDVKSLIEFLDTASLDEHVPITGQLKPFDPDALDRIIRDQAEQPRPSQSSNRLKIKLEHVALLRKLR